MAIEFALPFAINGGGGTETTEDPDIQVRQHVNALLNTQPGTRVMRTAYGVDVAGLLFAPDDFITNELLRNRIEAAFTTYEPAVRLKTVDTDLGSDGELDLRVEYQRTGDADSAKGARTNVAVIAIGGRVTEIVKG